MKLIVLAVLITAFVTLVITDSVQKYRKSKNEQEN